jgi:RecA/RadA recombinase
MVKKGKFGSDKERIESLISIKSEISANVNSSEDYRKAIKKLTVEPIRNPLTAPEVAVRRVLTHTALDRILSNNGGIEAGSTVELYGVPASGKTQICEALAAEGEGLIIYVDVEHTFREPRFIDICKARGKDIDDINTRLLLYKPEDWQEQEAVVYNLPEYDAEDNLLDVGMVIVDSLMKHWGSDSDFYGREKLTRRQQLVRAEMEELARYVRRHNAVLIFTNQVYEKPVANPYAAPEDKVAGRGGLTVYHFSDYRIFLRKGFGNMRFARLVDSPDLPLMEVPFILEQSGIMDIPDPVERAKAVMGSEEYATKFLSGRAGSKPAGKEYLVEALKLGYVNEKQAEEQGLTQKEIEKAVNERTKTLEDRMIRLSPEEEAVLADDTVDVPVSEEDKVA